MWLVRVFYNAVDTGMILAATRENLSSGFATRVDSNRSAQLEKLRRQRFEISDIETRGIILSMQRQ